MVLDIWNRNLILEDVNKEYSLTSTELFILKVLANNKDNYVEDFKKIEYCTTGTIRKGINRIRDKIPELDIRTNYHGGYFCKNKVRIIGRR